MHARPNTTCACSASPPLRHCCFGGRRRHRMPRTALLAHAHAAACAASAGRAARARAAQERRKELTKKVSKMGEDGKVAVRNVRKDILKRLDKYEFPQDVKKGLEEGVQKTTDGFVKKLDDMVKAKSDDIMKV